MQAIFRTIRGLNWRFSDFMLRTTRNILRIQPVCLFLLFKMKFRVKPTNRSTTVMSPILYSTETPLCWKLFLDRELSRALTLGASPMWRWDFCLVSQSCLRWRITSSFSSWSDAGFSLCRNECTNTQVWINSCKKQHVCIKVSPPLPDLNSLKNLSLLIVGQLGEIFLDG